MMTAEELFDDLHKKYGEDFNWRMCALSDRTFREQAAREIKPGHFLYGKTIYSVARCDSNDDVLFVTGDSDGSDLYVVVHLTWNDNADAAYPRYIPLGGLDGVREYIEAQQ